MERRKCCLLGIPDQEGIRNVGGRIGAAQGPESFRKAFARLKGRDPIHAFLDDLGDVSPIVSDVSKNHRQAADLVRRAHTGLARGSASVVVGGGHDHGYSHLLGIHEAFSGLSGLSKKKDDFLLGCLNIDAHFDVRKPDPKISSGSPFYLALESGLLAPKNFIEFGIQSHANAPALWDYIHAKKIETLEMKDLRFGSAVEIFKKSIRKLSKSCDAVVVSFDLDAVADAYAPGVSAPQTEGFTPSEILAMMEFAGADRSVVSLGIFELNPVHDIGDRTARLAATAAYHFIQEVLKRKIS